MEEYTLLDCRLAEKRFEQEREFQLSNLRMVLASVINTTASKKSQIVKPEDVMNLPSDSIKKHQLKKAKPKTADIENDMDKLLELKKLMPDMKLPKNWV